MKTIMSLICTMLCLLAFTAGAGEISKIDGVLQISNGTEAADGVEDLKLTELWRHGGEDDEVFFGIILQAISDDDGNIYLLDQQLSEVKVFSPDGEFLKTLSREGDGPGEVRAPTDILWMPDGSLGIVQTFPGRIVKIDMDDNPVGVFKTGADGAIIAVAEARARGGNLVMGVIDIEVLQGGQDRHIFLASYDAEGVEKCRYTGFDVHWDFNNMVFREREQYFAIYGKWDLSPDGKMVAVPNIEEYTFNIFAADGTVERVVTREIAPFKREDEDRKMVTMMMEGASRQFPFPIETEIEDFETPIGQLKVHPDGNIWILPAQGSRNQPEGVLATWDVFNPDGHFIRQMRVKCPGDGRKDGVFMIGSDRVLVVRGFVDAVSSQFGGDAEESEEDPAPVEVICYRIDS